MRFVLPLLTLLAGCSSAIGGDVRDAATGRPIAGARVEVATSGWGERDGQLVWDKEYSHSAESGPDGSFRLEGIDGGHRLAVRASRYQPVETSLCSRSPMIVRLGGPFEGADLDRQLRIGVTAAQDRRGWSFAEHGFAPAASADLVLLATAGDSPATLRAPHGMSFVTGTGNPPAPPRSGYVTELKIDLLQCGWLFVRFEGGVAAVRTGSMATDEPAEGGRYLLMSYGVMRL